MDTDTAYGLRLGAPLNELAQVGQGTPYGEVLRRYWQPIALVGDATTRPMKVKVLGEELILFRTRKGRPGLLHPRCTHRGASLYFGGVEDDGIRCSYHGWVFDAEGRTLEQPCEPEMGLHRDRMRQPWYPVQEQYGLIWVYMGPPDKKPLLPRYDTFENLAEDEVLIADDNGVGGGGPSLLDFNWLQHWENVMDPFHVPILHARFSGNQFTPEMAIIPEVTFEYTPRGVRSVQHRGLGDGPGPAPGHRGHVPQSARRRQPEADLGADEHDRLGRSVGRHLVQDFHHRPRQRPRVLEEAPLDPRGQGVEGLDRGRAPAAARRLRGSEEPG